MFPSKEVLQLRLYEDTYIPLSDVIIILDGKQALASADTDLMIRSYAKGAQTFGREQENIRSVVLTASKTQRSVYYCPFSARTLFTRAKIDKDYQRFR